MYDTPFLEVRDLEVATGMRVPDFELNTSMNLLLTGREASATTTMLTLSGRMKPKSGDICLQTRGGETLITPRDRGARIALAGVPAIDGLDRNVPARTYIRETSAWANPWYRRTPRKVQNIEQWQHVSELFDLHIDPDEQVGKLNATHRFILRVALALIARPDPELVIIDDIDQVRSHEIRAELIDHLRVLSEHVPVIVASTNRDTNKQFDRVISLEGSK
ncbi:hypothetical protein [Corynebacterium sp. H130]|uniref:hypothetical protein n=1 Tax=Corynebacterium sp. H130 TaxID=3133444 RepID=UPI0030AFF942